MRYSNLLHFTCIILYGRVNAQQYDRLHQLKDHLVNVYFSPGQEHRATSIVQRVDKAITYYHQLLHFKPSVVLLVLSQADWTTYTNFPVYGMPHYRDDHTLVVAAEDNVFWKSFLPPLDQLPEELRAQVQAVYKKGDSLSMEAFFDLLALHELGHAFHFQAGLNMQRKWMGEVFVNILLHTYIAENEKAALPALTLFPAMVINSGTKDFAYTSLKDIQERYDEIGQLHPKNYGWYQSRWHSAAAKIYDEEGVPAVKKLWEVLTCKELIPDDEQLVRFFETAGLNAVGQMIRNWDRDMAP